jgi:hypothetical protein
MKKYMLLLACITVQSFYVQSWWGDDFKKDIDKVSADVKKTAKKATGTVKNVADKTGRKLKNAADDISALTPTFLYYMPKLSLLYPITDMSIQCDKQTFQLIANSDVKEPALFTRLSMIDKHDDLFIKSKVQQNMKNGIYFRPTYDASTKKLTITSSENFVHLGKITDIGSVTYTLDKAPGKIIFKANGKTKSIKQGGTMLVTPWLK